MRQTGCPCQRQVVPWLCAVELVQLLAGPPWENSLHCRGCSEQGSQAALHPDMHWGVCHHFQFLPTVSQTQGIVLLGLAWRAEEGPESWQGNFLYPRADGQVSFVDVSQLGETEWSLGHALRDGEPLLWREAVRAGAIPPGEDKLGLW